VGRGTTGAMAGGAEGAPGQGRGRATKNQGAESPHVLSTGGTWSRPRRFSPHNLPKEESLPNQKAPQGFEIPLQAGRNGLWGPKQAHDDWGPRNRPVVLRPASLVGWGAFGWMMFGGRRNDTGILPRPTHTRPAGRWRRKDHHKQNDYKKRRKDATSKVHFGDTCGVGPQGRRGRCGGAGAFQGGGDPGKKPAASNEGKGGGQTPTGGDFRGPDRMGRKFRGPWFQGGPGDRGSLVQPGPGGAHVKRHHPRAPEPPRGGGERFGLGFP